MQENFKFKQESNYSKKLAVLYSIAKMSDFKPQVNVVIGFEEKKLINEIRKLELIIDSYLESVENNHSNITIEKT